MHTTEIISKIVSYNNEFWLIVIRLTYSDKDQKYI